MLRHSWQKHDSLFSVLGIQLIEGEMVVVPRAKYLKLGIGIGVIIAAGACSNKGGASTLHPTRKRSHGSGVLYREAIYGPYKKGIGHHGRSVLGFIPNQSAGRSYLQNELSLKLGEYL